MAATAALQESADKQFQSVFLRKLWIGSYSGTAQDVSFRYG